MTSLARYAKAILGALIALATYLGGQLVPDSPLGVTVGAVLAFLVALAGVWGIPNAGGKPKPTLLDLIVTLENVFAAATALLHKAAVPAPPTPEQIAPAVEVAVDRKLARDSRGRFARRSR